MPMDEDDSYEPDVERVQESSNRRRRDRTASVEDMIGDVGMLEEEKYPATSEELAVEYVSWYSIRSNQHSPASLQENETA